MNFPQRPRFARRGQVDEEEVRANFQRQRHSVGPVYHARGDFGGEIEMRRPKARSFAISESPAHVAIISTGEHEKPRGILAGIASAILSVVEMLWRRP